MSKQKNVASQKLRVRALDAAGSPVTGDAANITCKVSKDGGSLTATNDTNPTELEAGYYEFDLTQAETNADDLLFVAVSATSAVYVDVIDGANGATIIDRAIQAAVDGLNSGNAGLMQSTTIATLTSQTVGTLTAGSADDDAYNGHAVIITDQSTSTQKWAGVIEDYVGATKTFTLRAAPGFNIAAGDSIAILASQDGNVLDLISQTQNSITFSPDRDRTWVVRRNSTSKTITKRTDETAVFYVDCSKLMGTGEFLGAADTFSVNVNDSGCTVASGYPTKESGTIIGVKLSGGTSSDSAYTLDIEFQTDQGSEPIEASVKLLVVASETE